MPSSEGEKFSKIIKLRTVRIHWRTCRRSS